MRSLEERLQQAAKDGSVRSGIILGVRLVLVGLNRLECDSPWGTSPELSDDWRMRAKTAC